jgi:hypothetical protein
MFQKKGQITLFIILGIVLIVSFSLVFYLFQSNTGRGESEIQQIQSFELSTSPIKSYVDSCLQNTATEAIDYIGKHGGYYDLDQTYSTNSAPYNTAYYFYRDINSMPSINIIEKELSNYINDNLFFCLQNFVIFEEQGFNIDMEEIKSKVSLHENNAVFNLEMPLKIKREDQQKTMESFTVNINSRLKKMIDSASILTSEQVIDPDYICMSCIFRESMKNDFIIELSNMDNDSVIIRILDNETGEQLIYANKYQLYSCSNPPYDADYTFYEECLNDRIRNLNYDFIVHDIPDFKIKVNETFYYKINASGFNLSFYDYTDLFEISLDNGDINFTPKSGMVGNHTIWILIKDKLNNQEYKSFEIRIEDET